jgi:hypothetical protein
MTRDSPTTDLWAWLGRRVPVRAHRSTVGRRPPGARAPAKGRRGLDYTRVGCVGWVLGKVPEWLGWLRREHRRCPATAAMVSRQPSQAQGAACLRKEERVGLK